MIKSDVIVIGGGIAGMVAALVSARNGKRVTMLTYGEGTLPLNSGVIDILAYDQQHHYVENPMKAMESLPEEHPYHESAVRPSRRESHSSARSWVQMACRMRARLIVTCSCRRLSAR